jgi:hypothetical protein
MFLKGTAAGHETRLLCQQLPVFVVNFLRHYSKVFIRALPVYFLTSEGSIRNIY